MRVRKEGKWAINACYPSPQSLASFFPRVIGTPSPTGQASDAHRQPLVDKTPPFVNDSSQSCTR